MDKVVQQTASSAEESASAAEEMTAQADQMRGYVDDLTLLVGGTGNELAGGNTGIGEIGAAITRRNHPSYPSSETEER